MNHETKRTIAADDLEEDKGLIEGAQRDPHSFKPLYEKYFRPLFLFVAHRLGDREHAADVTQQVFFKALSGIHKFEFRGLPFSSWLYRIAINECNGYFRKTKHLRLVTLEAENIQHLQEEIIEEPLQQFEHKLPEILQKLSTNELTLIELRFFDHRSFREISEIMNLSEINAKVSTYRVLQKMKKLFLR